MKILQATNLFSPVHGGSAEASQYLEVWKKVEFENKLVAEPGVSKIYANDKVRYGGIVNGRP